MTILWDWNGTLLDDTVAALDTLNEMIVKRGGKAMTMEFYREHFAFPVRPFYDTIGIVARDDAEWDAIAVEYHEIYARQPKHRNGEAVQALEFAVARGWRQAIISALRQDLLEADVAREGLAEYFCEIYGTDNLDGASKLDRARELKAKLGDDEYVLIGDSIHDFEVAEALGVRCVLCAQGGHSARRLARFAPAGATLMDAMRMI